MDILLLVGIGTGRIKNVVLWTGFVGMDWNRLDFLEICQNYKINKNPHLPTLQLSTPATFS
jgi:hypothetical protein